MLHEQYILFYAVTLKIFRTNSIWQVAVELSASMGINCLCKAHTSASVTGSKCDKIKSRAQQRMYCAIDEWSKKKNNSKSKEIKQLQLEKNNTPLAKCGEKKKRSNLKREKMLGICEIGYVEREVGEEIEIFTKLTKHTSKYQRNNTTLVVLFSVRLRASSTSRRPVPPLILRSRSYLHTLLLFNRDDSKQLPRRWKAWTNRRSGEA